MVFEAGPDNLPISAILPSLTPTSPRKAGIPEPSTTRPFLINRSYAIGFLLEGRAAAVRPDPRHCSTRFPGDVRFRRMDRGRAMQKRAVWPARIRLSQGSVHDCRGRSARCRAERDVRRLLLGLVLIAVLFGSPYAALVLNQVMGSWSATAIEQDGSVTQMTFDPNMPPPDFVPVFPGASVVQSSRVVSPAAPSGVGFIELAVHSSAEEVRDFYRARLAAAGFTVDDLGTQGLNAATADPQRGRNPAPLAPAAAQLAEIVGMAGRAAEALGAIGLSPVGTVRSGRHRR